MRGDAMNINQGEHTEPGPVRPLAPTEQQMCSQPFAGALC